ncbi:MAG: hypothetical protein WCP60_10155 [bacterium]
MSDASNAPADLSNIGIDLSQIFRPSWTVESSDSTARLAAKFDDGDRGERSERQGGQRNRESQHRGPRPSRDRDASNRDRGPRPQSGSQGSQVGQRGSRDGGQRNDRDRSSARDHRRDDRRPEPPPKPMLEGWKLLLIPEHSALEAIAKQIRSRAKAYPLFELARLVVNLSDRYSVTLKAESEESPKLFRVKADGSLWTSRREAVSHLLSKHLEKFYQRSSITTEAPKGNYSVVAQCGMSGVLLGPPNHHEYQSRLLTLHSSRFKNLPFEVYKTRIKMMRDEALMEQWKTEQSTRTVFTPIESSTEAAPAIDEVAKETPVVESTGVASESSTGEISISAESAEVTPVLDTPLVAEEPSASSESSTEEPTTDPGLSVEIPVSDGPQLTLEEAAEHFQKNYAENEVEEAGSEITLPGRIALHESDPLLHELLIKTLQELDRFPLPLAQVIGKELSGSGLQIFKAHKKIIHVSVARPRYLDRATTPTSEGFRGILDYLEAHPNQPRDKQWAGMLALRTEPAGEDVEALKQREQALGTDLLWLLHQGHVLDFAMGNLQAAIRPIPQQKPTQPAVKHPSSKTETTEVARVEAPDAPEVIAEEEVSAEIVTEEVIGEEALESPVQAHIEPAPLPAQPPSDSHGLGHA